MFRTLPLMMTVALTGASSAAFAGASSPAIAPGMYSFVDNVTAVTTGCTTTAGQQITGTLRFTGLGQIKSRLFMFQGNNGTAAPGVTLIVLPPMPTSYGVSTTGTFYTASIPADTYGGGGQATVTLNQGFPNAFTMQVVLAYKTCSETHNLAMVRSGAYYNDKQ